MSIPDIKIRIPESLVLVTVRLNIMMRGYHALPPQRRCKNTNATNLHGC